jgi:hypothetical protein
MTEYNRKCLNHLHWLLQQDEYILTRILMATRFTINWIFYHPFPKKVNCLKSLHEQIRSEPYISKKLFSWSVALESRKRNKDLKRGK